MKTIEFKEITKAILRTQNYINDTPLVTSSLLNRWLGHDIFFKAECLQKIGAFKARGACNTIAWLIENNIKPKKIIANSSGNHAQAVAWASKQFGIPVKIYMPSYSSKVKIQATQQYGAEVELCKTRDIVDMMVMEHAKNEEVFWIPPFNHNQVIAGQGTVTHEILNEIDTINAIFAPCGGGGLLSGTVIAAHNLSANTKVFGAEPLNANDAAQSLRNNAIQKLKSIPKTLADGAMTMAVGDITFEHLKLLDGMFEIREKEMIYWTQWLTHLLKLHIEPTSALGMAAAFQWLKKVKTKQRVAIILSGGNIDQETQSKIWKTDHLDHQPSSLY